MRLLCLQKHAGDGYFFADGPHHMIASGHNCVNAVVCCTMIRAMWRAWRELLWRAVPGRAICQQLLRASQRGARCLQPQASVVLVSMLACFATVTELNM